MGGTTVVGGTAVVGGTTALVVEVVHGMVTVAMGVVDVLVVHGMVTVAMGVVDVLVVHGMVTVGTEWVDVLVVQGVVKVCHPVVLPAATPTAPARAAVPMMLDFMVMIES